MNSISFFKALLMKELNEKDLPGNQEKIAQAAEPKDKITAADFATLRANKKANVKEVKLDYDFNEDELEKIVQTLKRHYSTLVNPIKAMEKSLGKKVAAWDDFSIDEGQDHEVSMAQNSLKSIISSASQLMNMLGQDEKDIPAWIQDHITNAENYINQASKNYHEYNNGEDNMDELPIGNEEEPVDDMTLQSMMEDLFEAKKKPSAGLSKKQKSAIVKKAKAGKDMGKKGKGFEKIVKAAKKSGAKDPEAVAGAAFWKGQAKKAK